ncbi:LacI family DNA-binding transcriptional regulator [Kineococcus rhizosphaerae]|uniref:DNA-binding LacI/PurR family transcriptional regulator n=1 Tax=Kineococcus rhizosphaerae TaxID=559628 RepID=A0A2T0R4L6_9ACTN|nr:LacI family DNA-binding transcriptional regulator [Kineococcus rhizosphaerae]PRY15317.1 DNA-binding LacI/PurR family transcriptional regulator [Kineococcus rhizosphaerae]
MGKASAPTIVDLARQLGMSKTTVADALNGTGRTSEGTRERVRAAAAASGYRANTSARRLRSRTSSTVSLYIGADVRSMPFYMPFAFGAMEEAAAHGRDVTLITHADGVREGQSAGAIVIDALPDDPILSALFDVSTPLVSAGRLANPRRESAGRVEIDYPSTVSAALDLLAGTGSRRPALLVPTPRDPSAWSELIVTAYSTWCRDQGVVPLVERLPAHATNDELEAVLASAVAPPETDGLFFAWQDIADRAQVMLRRESTKDLRVATLVDTYLQAAAYPHDVLVDLNAHRFGRAAVRTLLRVLTDGAATPVTDEHVATLYRRDGQTFTASDAHHRP